MKGSTAVVLTTSLQIFTCRTKGLPKPSSGKCALFGHRYQLIIFIGVNLRDCLPPAAVVDADDLFLSPGGQHALVSIAIPNHQHAQGPAEEGYLVYFNTVTSTCRQLPAVSILNASIMVC